MNIESLASFAAGGLGLYVLLSAAGKAAAVGVITATKEYMLENPTLTSATFERLFRPDARKILPAAILMGWGQMIIRVILGSGLMFAAGALAIHSSL